MAVRDGKILGMISVRDVLDFQRKSLLEDIAARERNAIILQRAHDDQQGRDALQLAAELRLLVISTK